jgi:hypothetical protein
VGSLWEGRRARLGAGVAGPGERAGEHAGERAYPRGGKRTGPNPPDKGKQGSKRHVVSDGRGVPLAVTLAVKHTAANIHVSKVLEETVDTIAPVRRPRSHPTQRPKKQYSPFYSPFDLLTRLGAVWNPV